MWESTQMKHKKNIKKTRYYMVETVFYLLKYVFPLVFKYFNQTFINHKQVIYKIFGIIYLSTDGHSLKSNLQNCVCQIMNETKKSSH